MTYTCTVIGVGFHEWIAEPFLEDDGTESNIITYLSTDTAQIGQTVSCTDHSMQDCAGFQATLISITNLQMNGLADMVSTLTVTATAMLNETVVQYRGTTTTEILTVTTVINITSMLPEHVL